MQIHSTSNIISKIKRLLVHRYSVYNNHSRYDVLLSRFSFLFIWPLSWPHSQEFSHFWTQSLFQLLYHWFIWAKCLTVRTALDVSSGSFSGFLSISYSGNFLTQYFIDSLANIFKALDIISFFFFKLIIIVSLSIWIPTLKSLILASCHKLSNQGLLYYG